MGLFYTTLSVFTPSQTAVVNALRELGRRAFASPSVGNFTVVYDKVAEEQDFDEISELGENLSTVLRAPVLAAALHDDDVLYLWLFKGGECQDFYDSLPGYFDAEAEPGPPEGGDSTLLCDTFGRGDRAARVESLLRLSLLEDESDEIPGEFERHRALLRELAIPDFAAGVTYSSIECGDLPEEFRAIDFISTDTSEAM
jgi:hypothetical protein